MKLWNIEHRHTTKMLMFWKTLKPYPETSFSKKTGDKLSTQFLQPIVILRSKHESQSIRFELGKSISLSSCASTIPIVAYSSGSNEITKSGKKKQ